MIAAAAEALSWALIVSGGAFIVVGAIGLMRMPDLYTRMHAVSVIETLGAGLLILGLIIQAGFTLVALKLLFVFALMILIGPVATHALAQAALHQGVAPLLHEDRRNRLRGGGDEPSSADEIKTTPQEPR